MTSVSVFLSGKRSTAHGPIGNVVNSDEASHKDGNPKAESSVQECRQREDMAFLSLIRLRNKHIRS